MVDASVEPTGGGVEIVDSGTLLIDANRILRDQVSEGLKVVVIDSVGAKNVSFEIM